MVLGRRGAAERLHSYALQYPAKADVGESLVEDFHTFRQALNVASADQRILVLVHADDQREKELRESLKPVWNNEKIVGRFHFDFDQTDALVRPIEGDTKGDGIFLIRPGEFGQTGSVMNRLSLDSSNDEIVDALLKANSKYAATTKKKVYSEHVQKGRAKGIYFEGAVPYGEDRDGDGQIDHRGGGRSR